MAFAPPAKHVQQQHPRYPHPQQSSTSRGHTLSPPPPARFLHNGKVMEFEGTIFDKLVDPTLYTGTHKHRFDAYGRGLGLKGRRDDCELLDAGVMFEGQPGRGGGGGDAPSDRSETLWMKSLRAAVHSPSLAKKLSAASPTPSPAVRMHRGGSGVVDHHGDVQEAAPLVQAWALDADGRLVFDEERTHRLAMQQAHDAVANTTNYRIGVNHDEAAGSLMVNERHASRGVLPQGVKHGRGHTADEGRHGVYQAGSSTRQPPPMAQQLPSTSRRAQPRPEDARKHRDIASHMRKLLYDDTVDDDVAAGRRMSQSPPHRDAYGWAPEVEDGGGVLPPSLEETMAMLHAFESSQRTASTRNTSPPSALDQLGVRRD